MLDSSYDMQQPIQESIAVVKIHRLMLVLEEWSCPIMST